MILDGARAAIVERARSARANAAIAKRAMSVLDLTTLGDDDTEATVRALCARASTPVGPTAAVCVWARFVPTAKAALAGTSVRVATVVNFPAGGVDSARVAVETEAARAAGADEIDVVIPYKSFIAGETAPTEAVLRACRAATGTAPMKVIVESGAFEDATSLDRAARVALAEGADFLKTSTGKIKAGASLEAAVVFLSAIKSTGSRAGVKISGGVRDSDQAAAYLAVADEIMGEGWATPARFRFGASSVIDHLLATAAGTGAASSSGGY